MGKEPAGQGQRGPFTEGLISRMRSLGYILGPGGGLKRVLNQRRAVDQFVLKDIELLVGSKERTLAGCGNSQEGTAAWIEITAWEMVRHGKVWQGLQLNYTRRRRECAEGLS